MQNSIINRLSVTVV